MRSETIDLDAPPGRRWTPLLRHAGQARELLQLYGRSLGPEGLGALPGLEDAARAVLPSAALEELEALAGLLEVPLAQVLVGNLHYDLLKVSLGCSAFAVDTPAGPLHARNLDWWTEGGLLRDATLVLDCRRGGQTRYRLVGWPGFLGCFSGVAPGRFAVTLNAVLSTDPPVLAEPVAFLLRRTLDEAPDFAAAVRTLARTPIACDCLLMVTGPRAGEAAVVERTPTRAAVRRPERGVLEVTNDYRVLPVTAGAAPGQLAETSDGRSARIRTLLRQGRGATVEGAFGVLGDPRVRQGITVQQMVLQAATGRVEVRLPPPAA